MRTTTLILSVLLACAVAVGQQMPKNDPTGTWEAESGTRYDLTLTGDTLRVKLVEGSNPTYLRYEVTLKNAGEVNTYKGEGFFVAKLRNGKECRFDTEWMVVVVAEKFLTGGATTIIPDPETCAVKSKEQVRLDLNKK